MAKGLGLPACFDERKAEKVLKVDYEGIAEEANAWADKNSIEAAAKDKFKFALMIIDAQNTFCLPEFELFVGGRSGRGAIDDNVRLAQFIYKNLNIITKIFPTMDTHLAMQIFHQIMWVNDKGEHPTPGSILTYDDIKNKVWKINPAVAHDITNGDYMYLCAFAEHYAKTLSDNGKYALIVWPYHGMLGGIGHALVSIIEEAVFFHNICRRSQTGFEIKGGNPLTENYSIFQPEILLDHRKNPIASKNARFFKKLLDYDAIGIAGQAASHCVAWTIDDLLREILAQDPSLAKKCYIIGDCTSPVVIPGVFDFTDQAKDAFKKFEAAGMNIVSSTTTIDKWPGINL